MTLFLAAKCWKPYSGSNRVLGLIKKCVFSDCSNKHFVSENKEKLKKINILDCFVLIWYGKVFRFKLLKYKTDRTILLV